MIVTNTTVIMFRISTLLIINFIRLFLYLHIPFIITIIIIIIFTKNFTKKHISKDIIIYCYINFKI